MSPSRIRSRGLSYIELIIVMAIIGLVGFISYPGISTTLSSRSLDIAASDILMSFQTAKWQAASTKLAHRVLFVSTGGAWTYRVEKEATSGSWTVIRGGGPKSISTRFSVTLNLPAGRDVVFLATGFVSNYDSTKNSITLDSAKLRALGQAGRRIIRLFAGGSVKYEKA